MRGPRSGVDSELCLSRPYDQWSTRTRPCKARLPHAAQNLAEVRRMTTKAPASYRAVEIPLRWNNDLTWSFTVRFRDRLGPGAVQLPNISRLGRIKWSKCSWSRIVEPAPTSRCNSYWVDYSLESDLLYPATGSRFPSSRLVSTETFVRQHCFNFHIFSLTPVQSPKHFTPRAAIEFWSWKTFGNALVLAGHAILAGVIPRNHSDNHG